MARKRHTAEEIVAKLRQVDVLMAQGKAVADAVHGRDPRATSGGLDLAGRGRRLGLPEIDGAFVQRPAGDRAQLLLAGGGIDDLHEIVGPQDVARFQDRDGDEIDVMGPAPAPRRAATAPARRGRRA